MTAVRIFVINLKRAMERRERMAKPRWREIVKGRGQPCLLAILGFLPFRIPACIVPILSWNVLSIWTRCFLFDGI